MSLVRVAVDAGQILLNQWATTPPHNTPQEGRFKTKGETIFGLAPVIFWVSGASTAALVVANVAPLASKTIALYYMRLRVSDRRPLPYPPILTKLVGAHFISLLPIFPPYGQNTLSLRHVNHIVRDPPDGLWNLPSPAVLRSPRVTFHL